MSGGWFCANHNVQFNNQNYCELCKIDDARCPYCNYPAGKHYDHCIVFQKQKEIKMTREEAYTKLVNADSYVDALEALGLLKFDEVKKRGTLELYKCGITESNLEALEKAGYEIIKVIVY